MKTKTKWFLGIGAGAGLLGLLYLMGKKVADALKPSADVTPTDALPGPDVARQDLGPGGGPGGGDRIYATPGSDIMPNLGPVTSSVAPTSSVVDTGTVPATGSSTTGPGDIVPTSADKKARDAVAELKTVSRQLRGAGFAFVPWAQVPLSSLVTLPEGDAPAAYAALRAIPNAAAWTFAGGRANGQMFFSATLKVQPKVKVALLYTPKSDAPYTREDSAPAAGSGAPAASGGAPAASGGGTPTESAVVELKKILVSLAGKGWTGVMRVPANAKISAGDLQTKVLAEVQPIITADAEGAKAAGVALIVANDAERVYVGITVKGKGIGVIAKSLFAFAPTPSSGAGSTQVTTTPTTGTSPSSRTSTTPTTSTSTTGATSSAQRQAILDKLGKVGWTITTTPVSSYRVQGPSPLILGLHGNLLKAAGMTADTAAAQGIVVKYYADLTNQRLFAVAAIGGQSVTLRYIYPYIPDTEANGLVTTSGSSSSTTSTSPRAAAGSSAVAVAAAQRQAAIVAYNKMVEKLRSAGLIPIKPEDVPAGIVPVPVADAKRYYAIAAQMVGPKFSVAGFTNAAKSLVFIRITGTAPDTKSLVLWLKMVLGQRNAA